MIKKYLILTSILFASTASFAGSDNESDDDNNNKSPSARPAASSQRPKIDVSERGKQAIRNALTPEESITHGLISALEWYSRLSHDADNPFKAGMTHAALTPLFTAQEEGAKSPFQKITDEFYAKRRDVHDNLLQAAGLNRQERKGEQIDQDAKSKAMQKAIEEKSYSATVIRGNLANAVKVAGMVVTGILSEHKDVSGAAKIKYRKDLSTLLMQLKSLLLHYEGFKGKVAEQEARDKSLREAVRYSTQYQRPLKRADNFRATKNDVSASTGSPALGQATAAVSVPAPDTSSATYVQSLLTKMDATSEGGSSSSSSPSSSNAKKKGGKEERP